MSDSERAGEDLFEMPGSWKSRLYLRRGGITRSVKAPSAEALMKLRANLDAQPLRYAGQFENERVPPVLAKAGAAYLRGVADPLGAAVVLALDEHYGTDYRPYADAWLREFGVEFAVRATAALYGLRPNWDEHLRKESWSPWLEGGLDDPAPYEQNGRREIAVRVRNALAMSDEDTYRAAVAALADVRDGEVSALVAAFLAPSETVWTEELVSLVEGGRQVQSAYRPMLLACLNSPEQAARLGESVRLYGAQWAAGLLGTLAEGIGPRGLVPLIRAAFDNSYISPDDEKLLANALAEIPTDEALDLLLSRPDSKHIRASLLTATGRFPARALRLLPVAITAAEPARASVLRQILVPLAARNQELAREVMTELPAEAAEVLRPPAETTERLPETTVPLPQVLATPPWTRPRPKKKPQVVTGLSVEDQDRIEWLPGEREEWAAQYSWRLEWDASLKETATVERLQKQLARHDGLYPAHYFHNGDLEAMRPHLISWAPTDFWDAEETLKPIAARYGDDAVHLLLRAAAAHPASAGTLILPVSGPRAARLAADWAVRLKSAGTFARKWFARHGATAARHLVPDAVGPQGAERRAAEQGLRLIAATHGDVTVRKAAATYGEQAAAAVEVLLAADPLVTSLPARMPAEPVWADPALLPQLGVRAADGTGGALPDEATRHVVMMLALSRPGDPYPGINEVIEFCDAESLTAFAWQLFEQWRMCGMPPKESWALHALGLLGDDSTVRALTPLIRAWPGEGAHHRAVEGLDVLAAIGTDVALLHLHGVSQRVKFKALKERAKEKISEVAQGLGLSGDQLADRLVPDFGLDAAGSTVVDYGTRRFTVGFDEQLRPFVLDEDGARRKDLPKPGTKDDADLAPAERKRFMALKKDVRTVAGDQVRRLETAMLTGRTWTAAEFRELFVAHPLLWHLVRRLVWQTAAGEGDGGTGAQWSAFRVAEDRTFADVEDDVFVLADEAVVRIAHPVLLGDELAPWAELFADYEILQPFPQLGRAVHELTEEEAGATRLHRFEGITVPTVRLVGLERRGWQRGEPQDGGVECWISKPLPDGRHVVLTPSEGIAVGAIDIFPEQKIDELWIDDRLGYRWRSKDSTHTFGSLDSVSASELLADLTELTAP